MEKLKEEGTLYEQYIKLIKILIKDNVNKDILLKYLLFLKDNYEKLKDNKNIESYEDERKYYSVCFNQQELVDKFQYKKEKDEKTEFLLLLKTISDERITIDSIISELKKNKQSLRAFNQPIEFNNRELYFYMCKSIVPLEILKNKKK